VIASATKTEATSRGARMLRTALGPSIAGWLEDPAIVEVMLNPDGRLWVDRLAEGLADTGERLSAADGERIVRLVAHHVGAEVHAGSPRISAELPETGERFEGLIPPVVAAPAFAIRKPAVAVFTLDDYVAAGITTAQQADVLRHAVTQRRNVLVAGGTSTGKTTLVNALLAEVAKTADRVVLIEDTRELQCKAPNLVALRTPAAPRPATPADLTASSIATNGPRISSKKRAPATVTRTPVRSRSNSDTPKPSSSAFTRRLTAEGSTPSTPAARRKLRQSATSNACLMEMTSTPCELNSPAGRDLLPGIPTPRCRDTGSVAFRAQILGKTWSFSLQPGANARPSFTFHQDW